jgi:hypothetical protein
MQDVEEKPEGRPLRQDEGRWTGVQNAGRERYLCPSACLQELWLGKADVQANLSERTSHTYIRKKKEHKV